MKEKLKNNLLKNINQNVPKIFHFNFDDPNLDKKWAKKDADITDYFNYGFNESIWKLYANKVRSLGLNE